MKQSIVIIAIIAVIALIGGVIGFQLNKPPEQQALGGEASQATFDLIGTKTGTSTAGVNFSVNAASAGQSATSTYPYKIGNETDSATITLKAKNASSTANIQFSILGSNDEQCNTTATSSTDSAYSTYAGVVITDVNWFDLGDHLNNKVHSTSLAIGTSTLVWLNPAVATGRELLLSDLNSRCLALQVSGSSTVLHAQLTTKKFR